MTYSYKWPMAAPCSAVLIYTVDGRELKLLTTHRHASVGAGRCLSAGGFYEVREMFNKNGMHDGRIETYREMVEELGAGIERILPYEDFFSRARHLWDGMVTTDDPAIIHSVTFRTVEVSEDEMNAIVALPATDEQTGKTVEAFSVTPTVDGETIEKRLADFKYPHEVEAAKMWYAKMTGGGFTPC